MVRFKIMWMAVGMATEHRGVDGQEKSEASMVFQSFDHVVVGQATHHNSWGLCVHSMLLHGIARSPRGGKLRLEKDPPIK
jgi:hypothetical protein